MQVKRYALEQRLEAARGCRVFQEEAIDGLVDTVLGMPLADAMLRKPDCYGDSMYYLTGRSRALDGITFGRALAMMATNRLTQRALESRARNRLIYEDIRETLRTCLTVPFVTELSYLDPLPNDPGDLLTQDMVERCPALNLVKPSRKAEAGKVVPLAVRLSAVGSSRERYAERLLDPQNPYRAIMIPTKEGCAFRWLFRNVSLNDYYACLNRLCSCLPTGTVKAYGDIRSKSRAGGRCGLRDSRTLYECLWGLGYSGDDFYLRVYQITALPLGLIAAERLGMRRRAA